MEALGIDIKLLLAQGINFILFAIIFKKFLYAPFRKYLHKQMGEEEEKVRILADLQIREESLGEREKEILAQAHEQALKIIKEAEKTAEAKKTEIGIVTMGTKADGKCHKKSRIIRLTIMTSSFNS